MTYSVKELFHTLQGEGAQAGRSAVFCRFSGCNLWSGRESDRAAAICQFCDTEFVGTDGPGGGKFADADALARAVRECWNAAVGDHRGQPYVVCTGGEPLLQVDAPLIDALHAYGFEIGVETNGTLPAPDGVDWICVSPKAGAELKQRAGHELKVVWPQESLDLDALADLPFEHLFLQPLDDAARSRNTSACADYVRVHPRWRLSLQTHKLIGIP